ncbi:MAG: D-Ala-D-Ala carboxypeptidase family metallohydrolase [Fusobacteriaceae bacterium]
MNKYFKRKEFACKCGCGFDAVDVELLELLTIVRELFGKPVTITSACRCESHNAKVGGAKSSQHKLGKAADIQVKDMTAQEVQKALDDAFPKDKYGLGYGKTFTHLDVREKAARFDY